MPAKALPLDNLDEAIKLYESGDGGYQRIARSLGVSHKVLRVRLAERGTLRDQHTANAVARSRGTETRRKQRGLPEGDICDAYIAGASENRLASQYGVYRMTITRILLRGGIERRGIAEANRVMMAERTPEENARNAVAAHDAVRGRRWSPEEKLAHAASLHGRHPGFALELLYDAWLRLRGIESVPQHVIGPYNCDLGAAPVAVEIFGGNWHGTGRHAATFAERSQYILDQGWNLMIVWVDQPRQRLAEVSADYVAAFIEESRSNPALRGEYRVVWGDGQAVSTVGRQLHEFAAVPARASRKHAR